MEKSEYRVPIHNKPLLSIAEAAAYSNIGTKTISMLLNRPDCPFCFYVGRKKLVRREEFEAFLATHKGVRLADLENE